MMASIRREGYDPDTHLVLFGSITDEGLSRVERLLDEEGAVYFRTGIPYRQAEQEDGYLALVVPGLNVFCGFERIWYSMMTIVSWQKSLLRQQAHEVMIVA